MATPKVYHQIYIQVVFAVSGRQNMIKKEWKDELNKYLSGIITRQNQKSIIVNGMPDHIHLFFGLEPSMAISDLVREIKKSSTNFINDSGFLKSKFSWQEGYGAFSYSHSQIKDVYNYLANQEQHHAKRTFREEYLDFLKKFDIEMDTRYMFEWYQ